MNKQGSKRGATTQAGVAFLLLAALFAVSASAESVGEPDETGMPPNIVIILADDLGWKDVGYHGSEIRTPHIDRLAADGIELDRFYVQPTCSPTRTALMTGKSPIKFGITLPLAKNDTGGVPLDEKLLPEYLAEAGYQPIMVGKWHLGNYLPDYFPHHRGFEHFYGYLSGGVGYWDHNHGGGHDWQRNGVTLREEGYATHLLTDEAIRVLRGRDRSRPTFLYLALGAPHLPNEAPDKTIASYAHIEREERRRHAAMVEELDTAIGRIVATLESEGMRDNTLLVFSSDNGGLTPDSMMAEARPVVDFALRFFDRPIPITFVEFLVSNVVDAGSNNDPLPRGKGTLSEGGVRVPASISWPGHLESGRLETFMTISDVLPTLLEAIGREDLAPDDLDGTSQWGTLTGGKASPTPDYMTAERTSFVLYRAPWKLYLEDTPRLYDVFADPTELHDRASDHGELVAELAAAAETWPKPFREEQTTLLGLLWDPDTFGGPEDREPWADVAIERGKRMAEERAAQ